MDTSNRRRFDVIDVKFRPEIKLQYIMRPITIEKLPITNEQSYSTAPWLFSQSSSLTNVMMRYASA